MCECVCVQSVAQKGMGIVEDNNAFVYWLSAMCHFQLGHSGDKRVCEPDDNADSISCHTLEHALETWRLRQVLEKLWSQPGMWKFRRRCTFSFCLPPSIRGVTETRSAERENGFYTDVCACVCVQGKKQLSMQFKWTIGSLCVVFDSPARSAVHSLSGEEKQEACFKRRWWFAAIGVNCSHMSLI